MSTGSSWKNNAALIALALASTWALGQVGPGPEPASGPQEPPLQDPTPASVPAPTEAEIQTELKRAEAALDGKDDPDREAPVKPLRADVAIALPSDF
jgi:hypothetical protein